MESNLDFIKGPMRPLSKIAFKPWCYSPYFPHVLLQRIKSVLDQFVIKITCLRKADPCYLSSNLSGEQHGQNTAIFYKANLLR